MTTTKKGSGPFSALSGSAAGPARKRVLTPLILLALFPFLVGFRWPWVTGQMQREAAEAFEKGAYGRADEVWSELYRDRPGDPQLAYNVGTAKLAQKEYAAAIETLGQGLERTDDAAMVNKLRYNRGNAYYRLNELARAATEYEAALKADPNDEDAAYNLALCRRQQQPPGGGGGDEEDQQDQQSQGGGGGNGQQNSGGERQSGGLTESQAERMLEQLKDDEENFRTYFTSRPSIGQQKGDPFGTSTELDDVMRGMRGEGRERDW